MGLVLQNIRAKGLTGKIFWEKELATVCPSQGGGIFLWKAVEKPKHSQVFDLPFPKRKTATIANRSLSLPASYIVGIQKTGLRAGCPFKPQ